MSLHGELTGAAARRRERRLRSWLRHERQTVAMVLAEACHHSSGTFPPTLKERRMAGQDAYGALRRQKTARIAGLHPDELVEPGVQVRAVTVGYVAARVPTLAGHRLTSDDDGVDGRTVRFLLKQSLAEKKEWEEERRRLVQESVEQVRARVDAENAARHAASSSTGKRRKRKKRKKKKLPRGSSRSRARRRQRQWHVSGMAGMDQKDRCSCLYRAGTAGYDAPRAVFSSSVGRPRIPRCTENLVFLGDDVVCFRIRLSGSTVDALRQSPEAWSRTAENCGFSAVAVHRWSSTSFRAAEADPHGPVYPAVHRDSLVAVRICGRCPCCAGRAVSHLLSWRRHSCSHSCISLRNCRPLYPTTGALWFRLQKTAESPQLQFMMVVDIPFVPQTQILMVQIIQQTIEFPQLQY